jgi:predicted NAD/FAD-binding protein
MTQIAVVGAGIAGLNQEYNGTACLFLEIISSL